MFQVVPGLGPTSITTNFLNWEDSMSLIKTVKYEEAQGEVKEVYDAVKAVAQTVPKPLQMASISPGLLKIQGQILQYYLNHPRLSFPLMAHIRFLVASHAGYDYCINFNGSLLSTWLGVGEEQLEAMQKDPSQANLEDKDRALLAFVIKAVQAPDSTTKAEVEQLHGLGWTDQDIYEALYHGANMVSAGIAFKALKMGEE